MDVPRHLYLEQLPSILQTIHKSHFVTIDLEFSGISTQKNKARDSANSNGGGKPTIQQRYLEVKAAAEKYQVLQLGLTCVQENKENQTYVLQTYNFHVDPRPNTQSGLERDITLQSSAINFLLQNGFSMDSLFSEGVQYLSRNEEEKARKNFWSKIKGNNAKDVSLDPEDIDNQRFITRVRKELQAHKAKPKTDFLNIDLVHDGPFDQRGLNNYQKALVHQLVRSEFPEFRSISRGLFIQITRLDPVKVEKENFEKEITFKYQIADWIGLRWVVEALVGGDMVHLRQEALCWPPGAEGEEAINAFEELRKSFKDRTTIVAGHNLFSDLIYFYHCFIGDLPESVSEFSKEIHQLFPFIIDTKYVATYKAEWLSQKSSLQDLDTQLRQSYRPVISLGSCQAKYFGTQPLHEAGYDSFLTAKVMIRLSRKIKNEQEKALQSATAAFDQPLQGAAASLVGLSFDPPPVASSKEISRSVSAKSSSASNRKQKENINLGNRFSHKNPFDLLGDIEEDGDGLTSEDSWDSAMKVLVPSRSLPGYWDGKESQQMMPSFHNVEFWAPYWNKLRVFGTVEGEFDLDEK